MPSAQFVQHADHGGARGQPLGSEGSRRPNRARADRIVAGPSAPSSAMADAHRPRSATHSLSRTRLGPGGLGGQCESVGHVWPHLVVGDVEARHGVDSLLVETNQQLAPIPPGRQTGSKLRDADGDGLPVGLRPPFGPSPPAQSHPDCRWSLPLIAHRAKEYGALAA